MTHVTYNTRRWNDYYQCWEGEVVYSWHTNGHPDNTVRWTTQRGEVSLGTTAFSHCPPALAEAYANALLRAVDEATKHLTKPPPEDD